MEPIFDMAQRQALQWTQQYGYGAVVPALLLDPVGVPWAWIFLMLLAGETGKSIPLMLLCGFLTLSVADYAFYFLGARGGRKLIERIRLGSPDTARKIEKAEAQMRERGPLIVALGRFVPYVGRFVGLGAGLAGMPLARFAAGDAIGAALCSAGFGLTAHFVGRKTIDAPWFKYALGVAFVVDVVMTALSLLGLVVLLWKSRRQASAQPADEIQP